MMEMPIEVMICTREQGERHEMIEMPIEVMIGTREPIRRYLKHAFACPLTDEYA